MGCLFSLKAFSSSSRSQENKNGEETKIYSWDVRKQVDPKDFTLENKNSETIIKMPGSINGMQYIVQNLENCTVYILDHLAQISIDDCKNCKFLIGPCKGSVFIRDCSDCSFGLICQQFRTRDCRKITTFMFCATQPIIESSTYMKFGCLTLNYTNLDEQMRKANITPFNNNWNNIHDFTPVPGESNFTFLNTNTNIEDFLSLADENLKAQLSQLSLSFAKSSSHIPLTQGLAMRPNTELCLIVLFVNDASEESAKKQEANCRSIISLLANNNPDLLLVQTKKFKLSELSAENVFGTKAYNAYLQKGQIIGIEFAGLNCSQICHQAIFSQLKIDLVYVSQLESNLKSHIDNFYNFAEMQMAV